MGNPYCPTKTLTGKTCGGMLFRQHSGRRSMWVCDKNSNHRFLVGSNLRQQKTEIASITSTGKEK